MADKIEVPIQLLLDLGERMKTIEGRMDKIESKQVPDKDRGLLQYIQDQLERLSSLTSIPWED